MYLYTHHTPHTHTHTHTTHIRANTYTHTHAHTHTHTPHTHVLTHIHIHACKHTPHTPHIHVQTHTHTRTQAHAHTHTHTHTLTATGDYGAAIHNYLSAGSLISRHFQTDVPPNVWSQEVYKRLIACCSKLGYHTHALVLCQLLELVDYEFAFGMVMNTVGSMVECMFTHLWDMTIIEYLICILTHDSPG